MIFSIFSNSLRSIPVASKRSLNVFWTSNHTQKMPEAFSNNFRQRFENRLYPTFTGIKDHIIMAFLHRLGSNFQALKQTSLTPCSDWISTRDFHTSSALQWLRKQSRLNVVDDSELGACGRGVDIRISVVMK